MFGSILRALSGLANAPRAYAQQEYKNKTTTNTNVKSPNAYGGSFNTYVAPTAGGGSYPKGPTSSSPVTTGGGSYNPSTGGQSIGGGGDGGGYDDSALRSAWDSSRSALESILPTYDADYANFESLVNKNLATAKDTLGRTVGDLTQRYGTSLKNLLQTSRDLGQRTKSTFSGLGTLDSSAFGDEILKQEQSDKEAIGALDLNKNKDITDANTQYNTYEGNQLNSLTAQRNEVDRLKAGVRQAIANNDIQQAAQLSNYIQQIQANQDSLRSNLALAAAQGTDVVGNLQKINGVDFNNLFGQNLANRANGLISRLIIPTQGGTGAGYIGSSKEDQLRRQQMGLA